MGSLKLPTRLLLLVAIPVLILAVVSLIATAGLRESNQAVTNIEQKVSNLAALDNLGAILRTGLQAPVNEVGIGAMTWDEAEQQLTSAKAEFQQSWTTFLDNAPEEDQETITDTLGPEYASVLTAFDELLEIMQSRDRSTLALYVGNDLPEQINPFFDTLRAFISLDQVEAAEILVTTQAATTTLQWGLLAGGIAGAVFAVLLGILIYNSISDPLQRLTDTVQGVASGDFNARSDLEGTDELAELGQAFDQLLQERLVTLVQAERENEILNDSIIALLQAVSQLSQRDLTVKVPVTEDVTGPVADALNLLTNETATVLADVTHISEEVATASDKVKNQSDMVIDVATAEREEVERTAVELAAASAEMNRIAELAQACDTAADNAIQTTRSALETVNNTVAGINNTRDTIRETEKRIKRLGERSQEISSVVNIINTIAERTHILALNASMHAASAGEAGRGFAVVADEVQRLAQNSREATSQIGTLVNNIQTETADTVTAMNQAISQVVDGSRLAEQAGEQMRKTQETTAELVSAVRQIASRSQEQAKTSTGLLDRARQIQESTRQTSQQLQEQTIQTNNLVEYARDLLNSVRLFKLPEEEAS